MRTAALVLAVASCASQSSWDDLRYTTLDISSPVAFDEIEVVTALKAPSRSAAVLTPQLLASGATGDVLGIFERGPGRTLSEVDHLGGATTAWTWQTDGVDEYPAVFVIARSGTTVVGAGYAGLAYAVRDNAYRAEAAIGLSPDAEVWGLPTPYCVRLADAYLIGPPPFVGASGPVSDTDCDDIADTNDCKPDAFCDPAATDPAGVAACQCP